MTQLLYADCELSISTKSKSILRDVDLLKKFNNLTVSFSINTSDEGFRKDMDNASSIKERLGSLRFCTIMASIRSFLCLRCFRLSPIGKG